MRRLYDRARGPGQVGTRWGTVLAAVLALAMGAGPLAGQEAERYAVAGADVAIYNLAGSVRIEPGTGSSVVVEVSRGGEDAGELRVETGSIDGRQTLRVIYPDDDVVYPALGRGSRTQLRVRDDGTFYGEGRSGRRVTVSGSGRGLEAYADLRIRIPNGQRAAVFLAVGGVDVANVQGELLVDVGSAEIVAQGTRGRLRLDTGSGEVRVRDAQGDVEVDTGSGEVEVDGVRGTRLYVDTGSGRVTGSGIEVEDLDVDTGSGGIRLSAVMASDIRLDTGSGRIDLGLLSPVRRLEIDTGSGGVTLSLPASVAAELEVDTGSGGIDVDLPMYVMQRKRSYLLARLGEGGDGRITIDTGSGGVRIRGT